MKSENLMPKLQPPGAGLPWYQLWVTRHVFGKIVSKKVPLAKSRALYEGVTKRILAMVESIPVAERHCKILVPSMMGLEDSSRYWSALEVLEHLLIVGRQVEAGILSLAQGKAPNGKADVAKVKPFGQNLDRVWSEFKQWAPGLMDRIDGAVEQPGFDMNTRVTFDHPWFGPMTARQWYWLLGVHQTIHYKQLKAIINNLN